METVTSNFVLFSSATVELASIHQKSSEHAIGIMPIFGSYPMIE